MLVKMPVQLGQSHVPVLFGILQSSAQIARAETLPSHAHARRRQLPVRCARGRVQRRRVLVLMAVGAAHHWRAAPVGPALDVQFLVRLALIAVEWSITGNVAVQTAGTCKDGCHRRKSTEGLSFARRYIGPLLSG